MPEGFASIDDMKVVLDADHAKLTASLDTARGVLAKFAGDGSGMVGKLDTSLAKVGGVVMQVRSQFALLIPMIDTGFALMQKFMGYLETAMSAAGLQKEWGELKKAFDGIASSMGNGLTAPVTALTNMLMGSASAAAQSVQSMQKLTEEQKKFVLGRREASDAEGELSAEMIENGFLIEGFGKKIDAAKDGLGAWTTTVRSALEQQIEHDRHLASSGGALGAWMGMVRAGTVDVLRGRTALEMYAETAAKISKQKFDNPFDMKEPTSQFDRIIGELKGFAALLETLVPVKMMGDNALEGEARNTWERIKKWEEYATALQQGEVGLVIKWLWGDESATRKKIGELYAHLGMVKDEINSREIPTPGFGKAEEDLNKQIAALEQKQRLFGLASGEAAELLAKEKALASMGVEFEALNKTEQEKLTRLLGHIKQLVTGLEDLANAEKVYGAIDKVDEDNDALEQRIDMIGREAGEAAAATLMYQLLAQAKKNNVEIDDEKRAAMEAAIARRQELVDRDRAKQNALSVNKSIDGLEREAEAIRNKTEVMGMEAGAAARLTAEHKILADARAKDVALTDEQREKMKKLLDDIEDATRGNKAKEAAISYDNTIKSIDQQTRSLYQQAGALDQSAVAAARAAAQQKLLDESLRSGHTASAQQAANAARAINEHGAAAEAKDRAQKDRAFDREMLAADQEILQIDKRTRGLYMEAGALAEVTMEEKMLLALRRQGIPLDAERLTKIKEKAAAFGDLTRAANEFQKQMEMLRSTGQLVSNSLMSAFDQWMRGTEIKGREMVANLLRELAKLTMMKGVLDPAQNALMSVFGSALAPAGGGIGGWSTTVLPGFAGGGTMEAGRAAIVGERGPEIIVPAGRMDVIPNHALARGGPASVNVNVAIDARGATRDAIPELQRQIHDMQRTLPATIVRTMDEVNGRR